MPATQKRQVLDRIERLREAVKIAREEANGIEVDQKHIAAPVLRYVFGQ